MTLKVKVKFKDTIIQVNHDQCIMRLVFFEGLLDVIRPLNSIINSIWILSIWFILFTYFQDLNYVLYVSETLLLLASHSLVPCTILGELTIWYPHFSAFFALHSVFEWLILYKRVFPLVLEISVGMKDMLLFAGIQFIGNQIEPSESSHPLAIVFSGCYSNQASPTCWILRASEWLSCFTFTRFLPKCINAQNTAVWQ